MKIDNKSNQFPLRAIYCTLFAIYIISLFSSNSVAFALTDKIENGIFSGAAQVYNILTAIVGPVAATLLAINAAKIIWGNQKAAEEAKSFLVKMLVALFFIFAAPLIIGMVVGPFSQYGGWSSSVLEP